MSEKFEAWFRNSGHGEKTKGAFEKCWRDSCVAAYERANDGGPAFPVPYHPEQQWENPAGMTLRDYFAAKAMQGMLACPDYDSHGPEDLNWCRHISETAYEYADAMLRAQSI